MGPLASNKVREVFNLFLAENRRDNSKAVTITKDQAIKALGLLECALPEGDHEEVFKGPYDFDTFDEMYNHYYEALHFSNDDGGVLKMKNTKTLTTDEMQFENP